MIGRYDFDNFVGSFFFLKIYLYIRFTNICVDITLSKVKL